MKKLYISLIALLGLVTTSCDDFLDVRPKGDKVENDLFETPRGFEEAIYGVYGSMAARQLYGKDLVWGIPELLDQNLTCGSNLGNALSKYDYDHQDVRDCLLAVWTNAYKTIGYANNVLENLSKKNRDDFPMYDTYRGEMLAVRAMMHFDLVRLFTSTDKSKQGIPYVTSYSFSVKPFVTVGEALDLVVKDLLEAESLLGDDETVMVYPRNNEQYERFMNWRETHLNIHAVRALLARCYWYMGNNERAAYYACKVIDSKVFPLVDETEVPTFLAGVLSPKETIFGLYSTTYLEVSRSYLYSYVSYHSYSPYDDNSGSVHLLPWHNLYNLDIDGTTQDFRKNQFRQNDRMSYALKMVDYLTIENTNTPDRAALISGISLIHSAEMYLIAADALLATDYDRALGYFNEEITSRGLTRLAPDVTLTAERIYNEFHKELFCEGQVWFNMKRLNRDIVSNAESRTIPASDVIYVLPIPKEEYEYRPEE